MVAWAGLWLAMALVVRAEDGAAGLPPVAELNAAVEVGDRARLGGLVDGYRKLERVPEGMAAADAYAVGVAISQVRLAESVRWFNAAGRDPAWRMRALGWMGDIFVRTDDLGRANALLATMKEEAKGKENAAVWYVEGRIAWAERNAIPLSNWDARLGPGVRLHSATNHFVYDAPETFVDMDPRFYSLAMDEALDQGEPEKGWRAAERFLKLRPKHVAVTRLALGLAMLERPAAANTLLLPASWVLSVGEGGEWRRWAERIEPDKAMPPGRALRPGVVAMAEEAFGDGPGAADLAALRLPLARWVAVGMANDWTVGAKEKPARTGDPAVTKWLERVALLAAQMGDPASAMEVAKWWREPALQKVLPARSADLQLRIFTLANEPFTAVPVLVEAWPTRGGSVGFVKGVGPVLAWAPVELRIAAAEVLEQAEPDSRYTWLQSARARRYQPGAAARYRKIFSGTPDYGPKAEDWISYRDRLREEAERTDFLDRRPGEAAASGGDPDAVWRAELARWRKALPYDRELTDAEALIAIEADGKQKSDTSLAALRTALAKAQSLGTQNFKVLAAVEDLRIYDQEKAKQERMAIERRVQEVLDREAYEREHAGEIAQAKIQEKVNRRHAYLSARQREFRSLLAKVENGSYFTDEMDRVRELQDFFNSLCGRCDGLRYVDDGAGWKVCPSCGGKGKEEESDEAAYDDY